MKKENLEKALEILKKNNAPEDVIFDLSEIINYSKSNVISLVDKETFLASQIWTEEDIIIHLEENGYEVTDENIEKVIHNLDIKMMEDCSDGNNLIEESIKKANLS